MKHRLAWLYALLAPDNPYDRHGAEMVTRKPRMEQPGPPHHPGIDLDAAQPSPVQPGGMSAHRIALAVRHAR